MKENVDMKQNNKLTIDEILLLTKLDQPNYKPDLTGFSEENRKKIE